MLNMGWSSNGPLLETVLSTHAAATSMMTGLIWFVQIVHYPLLARVPGEAFVAYLAGHQRRVTLVVAPTMAIELVSAVLLVGAAMSGVVSGWAAGSGAVLIGLVWGSTFLIQVPLHSRLSQGKNESLIRRLVLTNWLRTLAWSARMGIALVLMGPVWQAAGAWSQ